MVGKGSVEAVRIARRSPGGSLWARPTPRYARRIGRCVSSVSREVAKNGGRGRYRATDAQVKAYRSARRPKECKLENPRLKKVVTDYLESWWSPEQVASRLLIDFPDDPMMRVSHETIYKSIYVQGRGELKKSSTAVFGRVASKESPGAA